MPVTYCSIKVDDISYIIWPQISGFFGADPIIGAHHKAEPALLARPSMTGLVLACFHLTVLPVNLAIYWHDDTHRAKQGLPCSEWSNLT